MKKVFLMASVSALVLFSCKEKDMQPVKEANVQPKQEKEFEMYQMSEMAGLMEQMYVDNMRLRARIMDGDTIGTFPQHFLKIHASAMTDESENDAFFKEQAKKFILAQELIYKDSLNAQKHFNDAVSACVKCHEAKCQGPIPRIKKLYIN